MGSGILNKTLSTLVRMTGGFMSRPRNLLVIPAQIELAEMESIVVYGSDMGEIICGCGGMLAQYRIRGGKCVLLISSPLTEPDREAMIELGLDQESVYRPDHYKGSELPARTSFFYPFPPGRPEMQMTREMRRVSQEKCYFYESGFLLLPDTELCITEVYNSKLKAMTLLKPEREPQLSHALAIYRSAATGKGSGWYESFMSLRVAGAVVHNYVNPGEACGQNHIS